MSALRVLVFLSLTAVCTSSQTSDCSYLSLLKHLSLTTTNEVLQIVRPVKNWTTSTLVQVDMLLYGILKVDEKSQTVTSHVWLYMSWRNEFLTWNSLEFCGIKTLTVPTSMLWIPDVSLQEDASDSGSIYKGPFAQVHQSGWVGATFRQRLTSTCQLTLKLFPFDQQKCNFTFGSMTADAKTITLRAFNNDSTLTTISEQFMITQGEWELRNMQVIMHNYTIGVSTQSKLVYMVTLVRRPMLYVINLIVPLFYLLVLDLASFFVSESRGEKLNFKVTILLSISVLLLILKDMLPSTEDRLPLIASYCVAIFALVGISVLEAMLVIFLTDLDSYCGKRAPRCDSVLLEIQEAGYDKEPAGAEETDQVTPEKPVPDGPAGRDLLKQILGEMKAARQEIIRQRKDRSEPGRYARVAEVVDHVFFVLYFITTVVFLTYMYMEWIHNYVIQYAD
uniref:5-hydroxytryptamine receptor 3A-like isoform X2 n=1 Tax=Scatophagus argus TaxID=75038 RepID=UPI001ED81B0E|nr:5-hydroxytryptamine receptor 3A-like isoform X2 [Scatophagus argus]